MGKHFSFIHCADLHLGEPFGGLYSGDTGPWTEAIHKATFKAFENVVTAALTYRADAILISGDVYNSDHHSLAAQMAFARELYRAAQAGVQIFIIHGNHYPDEAWRADVPLPPSFYVFSSDKVESVPLLVGGETAAMVYGISYKNRHMRENLALRFRKKDEDIFSIGMLHTELGVAGSPYAPCTVDDLRNTKMDYWALGHVHARKTPSMRPYMVYPGNTQGLDRSESEKGGGPGVQRPGSQGALRLQAEPHRFLSGQRLQANPLGHEPHGRGPLRGLGTVEAQPLRGMGGRRQDLRTWSGRQPTGDGRLPGRPPDSGEARSDSSRPDWNRPCLRRGDWFGTRDTSHPQGGPKAFQAPRPDRCPRCGESGGNLHRGCGKIHPLDPVNGRREADPRLDTRSGRERQESFRLPHRQALRDAGQEVPRLKPPLRPSPIDLRTDKGSGQCPQHQHHSRRRGLLLRL